MRPEQDDAIAYLGAGLIALILIAIFLSKSQFKKLAQKYYSLLVIGLLFFIYAVYGHIDWGKHELINLPALRFFITYDFRSNGRFFWPCTYILLCFALVTVLKKTPKTACFILPLLIVAQIFDLHPYFKSTQQSLNSAFQISGTASTDTEIMAKMTQSKLIVYYPRLGCNQINVQEYNLLITTQELASRTHTPMNTAYTAHAGGKRERKICDDDSPRFNYIYPQLLVSDTDRPSPTMINVLHSDPTKCKIIGQGYYCLYSPIESHKN